MYLTHFSFEFSNFLVLLLVCYTYMSIHMYITETICKVRYTILKQKEEIDENTTHKVDRNLKNRADRSIDKKRLYIIGIKHNPDMF